MKTKKLLGQEKIYYFGETSILVLKIEVLTTGSKCYMVQAVDDNPSYCEVFSLDKYDKALEAFNIRRDSYRPDLSSDLLKYIGPKNFVFKSRGVSAKLEVAKAIENFPSTDYLIQNMFKNKNA